jgi:hypothetical protein
MPRADWFSFGGVSAPNEKMKILCDLCVSSEAFGEKNYGLIVCGVDGGNGLILVLGRGFISVIGKQVSYSFSFLISQHIQLNLFRSHTISASSSRAHSFSVIPSAWGPATSGELHNHKAAIKITSIGCLKAPMIRFR